MRNIIFLIALLLVSCQKDDLILDDNLNMDAPVALKAVYPDVLPLPTGFQPEGIVIGPQHDFYVGSFVSGRIYKGDLRTGEGEIFITPQIPTQAIGLTIDKRSGYLYVSGGFTGTASVYNYKTGAHVQTFVLTTPGNTLINDVIVTRDAAYFTDSFSPVLYKIPLEANGGLPSQSDVVNIPLTGFSMIPIGLPGFPVPIFGNGIDADPSGNTLIVANLDRGELYAVDPASGEATLIDLGGAPVFYADGILLDGKTLYVVQNVLNQIAIIQMSNDLLSGTIVDIITHDDFGVPATIDEFGNSLYAVNAHFDLAPPPGIFPDVEFEVVRVEK